MATRSWSGIGARYRAAPLRRVETRDDSIDPCQLTQLPVLVFGMDGADYDVVAEMIADDRLPTLRRLRDHGAFGPLRSTEPPVTPVAWSTFLTGVQPGRHGIYNFSTNPLRGGFRVESAAGRGGTPLWRTLGRGRPRSSFVLVPFTYPLEPVNGTMVSGYGGPEQPAVTPPAAAERIARDVPQPGVGAPPMRERYWEDFDGFRRRLIADVDEVERLCIDVLEADRPDLFAVDFMSSDTIGHLAYHLRNSDHPAHDPAMAADHIGEVYTAVDAAIGRVIEAAERILDRKVTAIVLSDHGMKPIHYTVSDQSMARGSRIPALPQALRCSGSAAWPGSTPNWRCGQAGIPACTTPSCRSEKPLPTSTARCATSTAGAPTPTPTAPMGPCSSARRPAGAPTRPSRNG